jgi:Zn-dependent protease with chaperone function
MTSRLSKSSQGALPPWLWFWLGASVIVTLREGPASWLGEGVVLFTGYPEIGTQVSLFRIVGLAFVLPAAVVFAGAATVMLPWARAAYLERRFGLKEPSPQLFSESPKLKETLEEISDFVHTHDPSIRIKVNERRTDQIAFVYPLGYRKAAIAVFSVLIVLWRRNRTAAEAVLLHEIGHRRHGDVLVVGAGSLFTTFMRYGLLVGTVSLAIGFTALGLELLGGVPDTPGEALRMVLTALASLIVAFIVAVPILILPLAGIWSAEFGADRYAIEAQGSSDAMVKLVDNLRRRKSRWHRLRWLVLWMSHPPDTLRRWAVRRYSKRTTFMILLLLFPVASLIGALGKIVWDTYLFLDREALLTAVQMHLDRLVPDWLAMAAFILLWPFVAGLWERLFGAERPVGATRG